MILIILAISCFRLCFWSGLQGAYNGLHTGPSISAGLFVPSVPTVGTGGLLEMACLDMIKANGCELLDQQQASVFFFRFVLFLHRSFMFQGATPLWKAIFFAGVLWVV